MMPLFQDKTAEVRQAALRSIVESKVLGFLTDAQAAQVLGPASECLTFDDREVKNTAASALQYIGDKKALPGDPDPQRRQMMGEPARLRPSRTRPKAMPGHRPQRWSQGHSRRASPFARCSRSACGCSPLIAQQWSDDLDATRRSWTFMAFDERAHSGFHSGNLRHEPIRSVAAGTSCGSDPAGCRANAETRD